MVWVALSLSQRVYHSRAVPAPEERPPVPELAKEARGVRAVAPVCPAMVLTQVDDRSVPVWDSRALRRQRARVQLRAEQVKDGRRTRAFIQIQHPAYDVVQLQPETVALLRGRLGLDAPPVVGVVANGDPQERAANLAIATATEIIISKLDEKASLELVDTAVSEIEKLN